MYVLSSALAPLLGQAVLGEQARRPVSGLRPTMLYTFTHVSTLHELYVGILKASIAAAVAFSVLISLDRLLRVAKYIRIKTRAWLYGKKPEDAFSARPLPDLLHGSDAYPRVAVQLPMFNERSVCQQCIASSCELIWPRDRFCVQVRHSGALG